MQVLSGGGAAIAEMEATPGIAPHEGAPFCTRIEGRAVCSATAGTRLAFSYRVGGGGGHRLSVTGCELEVAFD
jgi:hypothetical protein